MAQKGHLALANLERMGRLGVTVEDRPGFYEPEEQDEFNFSSGQQQVTIVTQNVDSLHQRAGSKHVLQLHGRGSVVKCMNCGKKRSRTLSAGEPDAAPQRGQGLDQLAAAAAAAPLQEPPSQRARFNDNYHPNEHLHEIPALSSSAEENSSSSSEEDDEDEEAKKAKLILDPALDAELSATKSEWDALLQERQEMGSEDDTSDWMDRVFKTSRRYRAVTDRVNAARIV